MFYIHFNQVPVHKNFEFKVPALTKSIQVDLETGKCVYCLVINQSDDFKNLGKGYVQMIHRAPLVPLIKTGQDWDRLQTDLLKSLAIDGEGTCGNTSFTCCTIRISLVLGLALSWLEGVLPFWTDFVSWAWTLACAMTQRLHGSIINIIMTLSHILCFSKIAVIGRYTGQNGVLLSSHPQGKEDGNLARTYLRK